eukprot:scaffold62153_cov61-Phaeocystis_antarctica.AAC.15
MRKEKKYSWESAGSAESRGDQGLKLWPVVTFQSKLYDCFTPFGRVVLEPLYQFFEREILLSGGR